MARTYLSGLVALVAALCKYITRYQSLISSQLAGESLVIFQALIVACNAFMQSDIPGQAKSD
jgi:hypothetical protein